MKPHEVKELAQVIAGAIEEWEAGPAPLTIAEQIETTYGKPFEELVPTKGYAFVGATRDGFRDVGDDPWLPSGLARCFGSPRLILRKLKRVVFEECAKGGFYRVGATVIWGHSPGLFCARYRLVEEEE